jgi:hypothetical protein
MHLTERIEPPIRSKTGVTQPADARMTETTSLVDSSKRKRVPKNVDGTNQTHAPQTNSVAIPFLSLATNGAFFQLDSRNPRLQIVREGLRNQLRPAA